MLLQGPTLHDVQRALLYDATRCRVATTHCRLTFVRLSARTRHVGIGLCRRTWPCGLRQGSLLPPFEIAPVRLLCRDVHRVAFETRGYYFAPSLSELPSATPPAKEQRGQRPDISRQHSVSCQQKLKLLSKMQPRKSSHSAWQTLKLRWQKCSCEKAATVPGKH